MDDDPEGGELMTAQGAIEEYHRAMSTLGRRKQATIRGSFCSEDNAVGLERLREHFRDSGDSRHAAFCSLAAARCRHALGTTHKEALSFSEAGWELLAAERDRTALAGEPSFEEYEGEGIRCYCAAVDVYRTAGMSASAAACCCELARCLAELGDCVESLPQFLRAAEMYQAMGQSRTAIEALWGAVDAGIGQDDQHATVVALNWIIKIASEAPEVSDVLESSVTADYLARIKDPPMADVVAEARVTLVLVLLALRDMQQAADYVGKLVEDASRRHSPHRTSGPAEPGAGSACGRTAAAESSIAETIALLGDLTEACRARDPDQIRAVQRELWPTLKDRQNDLLQKLVSLATSS